MNYYGLIKCCESKESILLKLRKLNGNIENMKIGDKVEFEMKYDRRNGKKIESDVKKIEKEVVLSEESVKGKVKKELRSEG
jgi:hypothetical protein